MTEQIENKIDERIVKFIQLQTAFTLATSVNNFPYCASCYFVYSLKLNAIIFKSNKESKHIKDGLLNENVAGSIVPDKSEIGKVKGIQFTGKFSEPSEVILQEVQKIYYKKYPYALAVKGEIWIINLNSIKFTDNTLGFGKKINWAKNLSSLD